MTTSEQAACSALAASGQARFCYTHEGGRARDLALARVQQLGRRSSGCCVLCVVCCVLCVTTTERTRCRTQ
eukprot:5835949-Pyramimonas_sp.AAC.1